MKNTLYILLFFLLSPFIGEAQGWELSFSPSDGGAVPNSGFDITQLSDSSYVVVGRINCLDNQCEAHISKISKTGELEWTQLIFEDSSAVAKSVIEDDNGDVLILGETPGAIYSRAMFLKKINNNGEEIWTKIIEDVPEVTSFNSVKIIKSNSDSYFVLGWAGNNSTNIWGAYLTELDYSGNEIWSNTYFFSKHIEVQDFAITEEGDFYIVGHEFDFQTLDSDNIMIKVNNDGNLLDTYLYALPDNDESFRSIIAINSNEVITAGTIEPNINNVDLVIRNIDEEGNINWQTEFEEYNGFFSSIIYTGDGEFVLEDGKGTIPYLMKLNSNTGEVIWEKEIKTGSIDLTGFRRIFGIKQTFDQGFILSGYHRLNDTSSVYIVKLDGDGNLVNSFEINQEKLFPVKVFPNPSSDFISFQQIAFIPDLIIDIYNAKGERIKTKLFNEEQINIDLRDFSSGVYFYVIKKEDQFFSNGKIIVEK